MPQPTAQYVQIVRTFFDPSNCAFFDGAAAAFDVSLLVIAAPERAAVAAEILRKDLLANLGLRVILLPVLVLPPEEDFRILCRAIVSSPLLCRPRVFKTHSPTVTLFQRFIIFLETFTLMIEDIIAFFALKDGFGLHRPDHSKTSRYNSGAGYDVFEKRTSPVLILFHFFLL